MLASPAVLALALLVQGIVRDADGAPIAGAEVLPAGGTLAAAVTASDGSFAFDAGVERELRLVVRATGFATGEGVWSADAHGALVIVLARARWSEDVTVTASRTETRLGDTPARVVVFDEDALQATAAPTVDDALRLVPGFSLFRRSDSRVSNPTAQGASLRGVGASGASRTLVLLDGVPLNDAFGGWVYWSRVPRVAVERVEVVEGGASDLYGSAALGGVVQALGRDDAPALALEATGGSLGTAGASLYAAERRGPWSARVAGEAFETDGYVLVPADERGPVDTPAGGGHWSGTLHLERGVGVSSKAFLRAGAFGESRDNGTPLQVNDTDWQELRAGGDVATNGAGAVSVRAWFATQTYHQTFSAVAADRASETLTRRQRVPSETGGLGLKWTRGLGARHALLLGMDGSLVLGRSDETAFSPAGRPAASTSSGGRETAWALFASDRASLGSRWLVTLGARLDRWNGGEDGSTALSPRASVLFRAAPRLRLNAAGYGAFRAPTLNERHRSFRVGNTVTLANPDLEAERLWGGELGVSWSPPDERMRLRGIAYASRIEDPIANVSVSTTPQLITRERRNLGRNRSRGIELDGEASLGSRLRGSIGYALIDASVESFPANPSIEGNQVPQVARHQLTFEARYADERACELSVQGRLSSRQFEDDRNELPLDGYFTLDVQALRRAGRFALFAAVENVTGSRYDVGLTPTPTIGPPRAFRVGARFR
ncbi:MAG TPA: TonB-dependent receptor [Vicinamibacteria bacterium]|nr:TonB-dependent receptor [Vicinamibacteria bacterium]